MNTKRTMSALVVSVICILLASSFVLQTSAETIETIASLQRATVVDAVIPDGFEGEQADIEYLSDLSVSDTPLAPSYGFSSYTFFSVVDGYPVSFNMDGVSQVYLVRLSSSSKLYIYKGSSYTVREIPLTLDYAKCFFLDDYFYYLGATGYAVYDYQGNVLMKLQSDKTYYNIAVFPIGSYIYVFAYRRPNGGQIWGGIYDLSFNLVEGKEFVTFVGLDFPCCFSYYNGTVYCFFGDGPGLRLMSIDVLEFSLNFDLSFDILFKDPLSSVVSNGFLYCFCPSSFEMIAFDIGGDFSSYFKVDLLLSSWSQIYKSNASIGVYSSSLWIAGVSSCLCYSFDGVNAYYNMIDYSTDTTFVPDRYLNFSYLAKPDGTSNGGGYVGFELDFGVPDYYYTNNEVTAFRFECMVGSYSNNAETFEGGIPPMTVEAVGGENWLPILNGKIVAQVGDVFLWAFTCLVYTSNDGPITSLKITLNQYIPKQTETHSFSLPCSALMLESWESASDAVGDLSGELTIIGNQIGQTNEKLDEIQDILTSLPDDHESNMQEWEDIMSEHNQNESVVLSYAESFFADPSFDESIVQGVSKGQEVLGETLSGDSSAVWDFLKYLWEVHPQMSLMTGIVITLSIGVLCIRMS